MAMVCSIDEDFKTQSHEPIGGSAYVTDNIRHQFASKIEAQVLAQ
jgi:hypothetical protein